jgi:four helix bundle protein
MDKILNFRDLDAWNAVMDLVVTAHALAGKLPASQQYELAKQMRRAAVSIPSNVAEGHTSGPGGRYRHHVRIALGSLAELDTQVELAVRLQFLQQESLGTVMRELTRTRQLLHGLVRSLRRPNNSPGA